MNNESGYNPMRWDCDKRGCFNKKRRPKIEIFHDLFPGKISFGDVDGIVEINARGLMLEWKSDTTELRTGQRIMYQRLSKDHVLSVIVLCGDAETMQVDYIGWVFGGIYHEPTRGSLERARDDIASWVSWAQGQKP